MNTMLNEPAFWIFTSFLLAFAIGVWKIFATWKKFPIEPVQAALEGAKEYVDNRAIELQQSKETELKSNEPLPATEIADTPKKNKGGRPKKVITTALILLIMTSCTPGFFSKDEIKEGIKDGIDIVKYFTTDKDSASVKIPIDSIIVKFNSVYYKSAIYSGIGEVELDTVISGYQIWELQTTTKRRTEFKKLDSIIYIYKK